MAVGEGREGAEKKKKKWQVERLISVVHKRDRKIQNRRENETETQSISQANSLILLRGKLRPRMGK